MSIEATIFLFAAIISIMLMFAMIYFSILFADMEWDFVNPIDLCNQLNQYVLLEVGVHTFLSLMLLIPMSWVVFIWNLPVLLWNGYKAQNQQLYYDSTEVFRLLKRHKTECYAKLGFYLLSFFLYLYKMIFTLMTTAY
jgi:hypothetical protein